jgi:hypothetical protein
VRLTTLVVFGAGYVLGSRAGRERYAQFVTIAEGASKRLEEYSARRRAGADDVSVDEPDRGPRSAKAAV